MKKIVSVFVLCLMLVATSARAESVFDLNLSSLNPYDGGSNPTAVYNDLIRLIGNGTIKLTFDNVAKIATDVYVPVAGVTTFTLDLTGLKFSQYTLAGQVDILDFNQYSANNTTYTDVLTLTGTLSGYFLTAKNFLYNSATDLELRYGLKSNNIVTDYGLLATATSGNGGGELQGDNVLSGSYDFTGLVDYFMHGIMFFNGADADTFIPGQLFALNTGAYAPGDFILTSEVPSGELYNVTFNGQLYGTKLSFATPEPASMLLLGSGLLGLYGVRRRRKAS